MARLLIYPELKRDKGIPYSKKQLDRLEAADRFPKRAVLSHSRVAWSEDEIDAWIARHLAARAVEEKIISPEVLSKSIDEADSDVGFVLSTRALNYFKNENLNTLGELVQKTKTDLLRSPNLGRKTLDEIVGFLARHSLRLGVARE